MNSLINNKSIAIIGGGPGGLTLARLLQMNGANVKVYERDQNRNVRVQGATLDLHDDSGLKALRAAGLMEAFNAAYRPGADKLRVLDKHANIIIDEQFSGEGDMLRPEIDRGPLREILLNSLQPDTVVWDSHFVALEQQADGIKMQFKNGNTAYADIVIAADGANSKIRPYITPILPFYAGITIVEGAVYDAEKKSPKISKILNGGKLFIMGDEKSLIVSSKGDGSLVFYTGCKTDEHWAKESGIDFNNTAQVFAWFKETFSGWDNVYDELFENASGTFIPRPQYCMPLNQSWETLPNLTMLGDAAHLMPPYAGAGVNMAMLDALELTTCLFDENFPSILTAITAYEKGMLARASAIAKMTLEQTDALHSANAIAHLVELFSANEPTANH